MSEDKKIAVVSSHTPSLFWFRMNMMMAFVERGYQVIAVGQEPEIKWSQKFKKCGIRYKQISVERNGMNPFHDLRTLKELKQFFKQEKPDKIFCYQAKSIIYSCLAARKCHISEVYPLIAGLGSVFRGKTKVERAVKLIMKAEYRMALKQSRAVMFQNNDDLTSFVNEKIVNRDKCSIINGSGVDIDNFTPSRLPTVPSFLMIARLIRDKGIIEYLDACRIIKESNPSVRCLLVGPFDTNPSAVKKDELQGYIDDGTIEYFGEQNDVRPFISQASVIVLPSYHEGTPKTVLEGMACGRAIITTDAPGCRETVVDGVNGFIVPIMNTRAVADKMQELIDNPHLIAKFGSEGRQVAVDKYDVKKVNESIIKVMNFEEKVVVV